MKYASLINVMRSLFFLFFILLAFMWCLPFSTVKAQGKIDFILPVDCTLDVDCLIVSYVDQVKGTGHADYQCNSKSYDGHKGVDFAVPNRQDMLRGVDVIAARAGTVLRVRNGEDDTQKDVADFDVIKAAGKECGNGVLIEHEDGWQSFYCHLKKDSILVKPQQRVTEGQAIAQIGQSGLSEFPHLHFSLIKNNLYIDPFTGLKHESGCVNTQGSLWRAPMEYTPFAVFDGGFETAAPDFAAIKDGSFERTHEIARDAKALVYWIGLYHQRAGDEVVMKITDPDGLLYHTHSLTIKRSKKRPGFYYSGRKTRNAPLKRGRYTAQTHISRTDPKTGIVTHEKLYQHGIDVR